MHQPSDIPGQGPTPDLRSRVTEALTPGETIRHAGWVVQALGGRSREEDLAHHRARANEVVFRPSTTVDMAINSMSDGWLGYEIELYDLDWIKRGRAGALFGAPDSVAAMLDSCLPWVEGNPVVLTVTATSLVILWPTVPLPPPPPPPPPDGLLRSAVRLPDRLAKLPGRFRDAWNGRPVKPLRPRAFLAPIPSPAPPLTVHWQLPVSSVASVTTADWHIYGLVDVTFTDGSRLRIAAPAFDHDAFAAALTGQTG